MPLSGPLGIIDPLGASGPLGSDHADSLFAAQVPLQPSFSLISVPVEEATLFIPLLLLFTQSRICLGQDLLLRYPVREPYAGAPFVCVIRGDVKVLPLL